MAVLRAPVPASDLLGLVPWAQTSLGAGNSAPLTVRLERIILPTSHRVTGLQLMFSLERLA